MVKWEIRFRTVVLVLLTFVVITAAVSGGRELLTERRVEAAIESSKRENPPIREVESRSKPANNRYVKVRYYTEESQSRNPPLRYVLFVEFGVKTVSIGQIEYGLFVDKPDLIDRSFSLAYFGSPGKDICPDGQKLNASGYELSEQDQQAGFYGATAGEFSLSPRRSLYTRIYSSEPLVLINCFIERIDGVGRARETCDDLELQVVKAQRCESRVFTYEPYQGD